MDEREQQNQSQSHLRQSMLQGKEALRKSKKTGKIAKKVITILIKLLASKIGIILIVVILAIALLAGFHKIIDDDKEDDVNGAAAKGMTTSYTGNVSTIETDEDGNKVSKIVIKPNSNDNGYQIAYDNTDENIENAKEYIDKETTVSSSEFTDFELGVLDALVDNGANLQYYTEEELHCFPAFIKAESSTQNLDLRPNSEKQSGKTTGDYIDNYEPEKMDNLGENEVPGVILVQRTNTNSTTPVTLEYKPKEDFDNLVAEGNKEVINYFTINERGNLVIAKWDHILITIEGEYPENLDDSEKDIPKDEAIITTEEIAYSQYISKYTMPFEFLVQLLIVTTDTDFCMEMVDYVLDSKIVINIQEEETITVTDETKVYTAYTKDKKHIDYTVNAVQQQLEEKEKYFLNKIKDDEGNDCTNYLKNDSTVKVHSEYITHSYVFEIIEADTWILHFQKDYGDTEQQGPTTTTVDPEPYKGEYQQVELEIEQPITDEDVINSDEDVNEFIRNKQSDYEPKISIPEITIEDKETSGKKSKEINASGKIEKIEISNNEVELPISYPEVEGKYNLPTRIAITTEKVASTSKTNEIPQIKYIYSVNSDETKYILQNDIDPLVECKVSSLNIEKFEKMDLDNYIETTITKYLISSDATTTNHIYAKDENGNFEKFLAAYDHNSVVQNQLNSIDLWLFEMMEENQATVELVDIIKYLLYIYDGKDRGVTDFDLGLFEGSEFVTIGNSSDWWWPIGSSNVELLNGVRFASGEPVDSKITSGVGPRWGKNHGGIDIANGIRGTNIIASKAGTVITVVDGYGDGYYGSKDGGGYGNHIKILHDDGTSSVYAHLERGTIRVSQGDRVEQGQLLGGMGTSGSSTGIHLHFEIRDANNNRLDPEDYVDPENPRPTSSSSLRDWLWGIEGGTQHINGNIWTIFDPVGGDDTMNLAHGMVVASYNGADSWYPDIIPGKITVGQTVTAEQANKIWEVKIKGFNNAIDSACAKYGVTLTAHQKDALVSYIYRTGYGRGQNNSIVSAYKEGGNAGLWNYMKNGYDKRKIYEVGTKARVAEEYELFVKGDYNYNPSGTTKYDQYCNNPNI